MTESYKRGFQSIHAHSERVKTIERRPNTKLACSVGVHPRDHDGWTHFSGLIDAVRRARGAMIALLLVRFNDFNVFQKMPWSNGDFDF